MDYVGTPLAKLGRPRLRAIRKEWSSSLPCRARSPFLVVDRLVADGASVPTSAPVSRIHQPYPPTTPTHHIYRLDPSVVPINDDHTMSQTIKTDMEIAAAKYRPFFEEAEKVVLRSREVWKTTPQAENELYFFKMPSGRHDMIDELERSKEKFRPLDEPICPTAGFKRPLPPRRV